MCLLYGCLMKILNEAQILVWNTYVRLQETFTDYDKNCTHIYVILT